LEAATVGGLLTVDIAYRLSRLAWVANRCRSCFLIDRRQRMGESVLSVFDPAWPNSTC
jgi:hypothetical protein